MRGVARVERGARRRRSAVRWMNIGALLTAAIGLLCLCPACERRERKSPPSSSQPTPASARLPTGWDTWSRDAALTRLNEPNLAVPAAIRMVRLAEAEPLCVPDTLTDAALDALRVYEVGASSYALGLADTHHAERLRAPVFFDSEGGVTLPTSGVEEELLVLHLGDTASFPHVVFSPRRVWIIEESLTPAIVLEPDAPVRFDVVREPEGEVLVLVAHGADGDQPVARYVWSVAEHAFFGPAAMDLPDPPGGAFEVDLQRSPRLEPVGGRMPKPKENAPLPDLDRPRPQLRDV